MELKLHVRLKEIMREKRLTTAELSRATRVPQQTITNWLSGMSPRSLSQLKLVSDYVGVDLDSLLFGLKKKETDLLKSHEEEINAGIFEVVLRRIPRSK